ncbi:hypothetical protein EV126DRAFT_409664 [Verticillium dahliae]|nr:hypothetical protein EV126DRAFT_409664 [Verticillium dahliae]
MHQHVRLGPVVSSRLFLIIVLSMESSSCQLEAIGSFLRIDRETVSQFSLSNVDRDEAVDWVKCTEGEMHVPTEDKQFQCM